MPLPLLSPVPRRNDAKPEPVRAFAVVGFGPWVKSGEKLNVACDELKVYRTKSIPIKPMESVWEPWILVKSVENVRASRGVAFKTPEPRAFSPLILTAGNAPGPPKESSADGRPTEEGSNGTPCGLRPSAQRPHPKLATITKVGENASVNPKPASHRLSGARVPLPPGSPVPKKSPLSCLNWRFCDQRAKKCC